MSKKCANCGFENRDQAVFCQNCGRRLEALHPAPVAKVTQPLAPAAAPQPTQPVSPPRYVPSPGSCYYHPHMFASYICHRCGRSICRFCGLGYPGMMICPECIRTAMPHPPPWMPYPVYAPGMQRHQIQW